MNDERGYGPCRCECHKGSNILHFMACCEPCPYCNGNYAGEALNHHISTCLARLEYRPKHPKKRP